MQNIRDVLRDRHVNYTEARSLLERHNDADKLLEEPLEEDELVEEQDESWEDAEEHTVSRQVSPLDLTKGQPPAQPSIR
jgi:hypothetical protein